MSAPQIAALLNDRYGFDFAADRVREIDSTATSTVYEASKDDGSAVQIELFHAPLEVDFGALDNDFLQVTHPGAFRPRHAGLMDTGEPYVLSEATVGEPLAALIERKRAAGEAFDPKETHDLLRGAAEAVDAYNAAGHPEFLARSINPERLLVQPDWSAIPVKLSMVGPSQKTAAAEDNLHDFWNVVAQLSGQPVNEEAAARNATAVGYLAEVTGVDTPAGGAPGAEEGFRKKPGPYPDGAAPAGKAKVGRNPWSWIIGALVAALLLMAGAWWWTTQRGEQWEGAEAQIAEAYPQIISKKAGQKGWSDLRCESATTSAGQEGKVRCAGEDLGVSVAKYSTETDRDLAVPGEQYATVLGSGACMIEDYEIPGVTPPAYAMAPRDKGQYLIVINGTDAEQKRLDLPVCE